MDTKPPSSPHPGVLAQMPPRKLHLLMGEILSLLMVSKLHRHYQIRDMADIILPALNLNQFRIYRDRDRRPVGFVTWGMFAPEVERAYLDGKMLLSEAELRSGDALYFMDFIAPYGHTTRIIRDLRTNLFPNARGTSLRFTEPGKRRDKPYVFYGVNYHKRLN